MLTQAKVNQAHAANARCPSEPSISIGDRVKVATFNHWKHYKAKGEKRVAKFMPHFNGPYTVLRAFPDTSTYELDIPNSKVFTKFHVSELVRWNDNDNALFPSRRLARPGPILMEDGYEEFVANRIVNERLFRNSRRYLVCWRGYGVEDDTWLPARELVDCAALDAWEADHAARDAAAAAAAA
ncbi:hypothetical protein HDZ31DRAFT_68765 [Schizophyllum fasciatum]